MLKVLFVASEAYPFAKTGTLGDFIGALPNAFPKDIDVRVMLPYYDTIPAPLKNKIQYKHHIYFQMDNTYHYCGIFTCQHFDITYYFIDNEYYFRRPELYGYFDDGERFSFFSRAVLECLPMIDFIPDIIHCNDWQTAAIPYLLKHQYYATYPKTKTVFTIHNIKYQGIQKFENIGDFLHLKSLPLDLEYYGNINLMKGALYSADLVTTLSPTYSQELKEPYYGKGLDGVIRNISFKEVGILGGIDESLYNPEEDTALFVPFSTLHQTKAENKKALQQHLGLAIRGDVPMISMVTDLLKQKGLELMATVIHEIMLMDLQLVIMGTGDPVYEKLLESIAFNYPAKMVAIIDFDNTLSRRIYAASDFILMPSKYEPYGVTQMIAMRYGTVPIVRETGGLKDTVLNFDSKLNIGNGFTFSNYNAHNMLFTIQKAVALYHNEPEIFDVIVNNAFNSHFSWEESAQVYLTHYKNLIDTQPPEVDHEYNSLL